MIVYHGSNCIVEKPNVLFTRDRLDFGKGFYVTQIKEQAEKWTQRFHFSKQTPIINCYELLIENMHDKYIIKEFEKYNFEWLDFIISCRKGGQEYRKYDIIIGGIANDRVYDTIELYFDNLIDKNEALKRLQYYKPNNQICIINQQILNEMIFISSEVVSFESK